VGGDLPPFLEPEKPMQRTEASPEHAPLERDQLEVIHFPTREARRQAIRVLVERGRLEFSTDALNVWTVKTNVVRVLQENAVPFEWVTRNRT
jgi:hypothetical protein